MPKTKKVKLYICKSGNYYLHYAPKYVGEIKTIENWCKTFFKENSYEYLKQCRYTDKDIAEYITKNTQQYLEVFKG